MKPLFTLLFVFLTYCLFAQNCETLLSISDNALMECQDEKEELEGLLIDGAMDEDLQEYADSLIARSADLKTERDEAIINENIAITEANRLRMDSTNLANQLAFIETVLGTRLDSLIYSLRNGNAELYLQNLMIRESILPPPIDTTSNE